MKIVGQIVRFMKQPAGFRIQWRGGGIVFYPPFWSWIVLVVLFDVCFVGTVVLSAGYQ